MMKAHFKPVVLLAALCWNMAAALPPAEQLLPTDTLLMLTAPDWSKAAAYYKESPQGQLWGDPELKPFRDKFMGRLQTEAVEPLERELGIKLADYAELLQGQATLAITLKGWDGNGDFSPGWVFLIDSRDKKEALTAKLSELKKKWVDSGKAVKNEKIREIDFTTLAFTQGDFTKTLRKVVAKEAAADASAETAATNKVQVIIGQSDSLFLIGNNAKDLEKILVRQAGGATAPLAEQPEFQASQALFRDSLGFAWLNFKPIMTLMAQKASASAAGGKGANPMMPKPDKVLAAIGLDGIKTFSASLSAQPEGCLVQFFLGAPESSRKGLLKILAVEAKNANPPAFVPADTVKFSRCRLDGQKSWAILEAMLLEISPEISGALQMALTTVGKDKDPNFDLKKSLIGNLGDDLIGYQKNPRDFTFEALNEPPSLTLVSSPNAEQLALACKAASGIMIPPNLLKEREFLGRKIVAFPLPSGHDADGDGEKEKTLNFAASGGYVAFSTDAALLEEYLRSSDNKPKPLGEIPGLNEAAQKVGGMNTGFWGYENQAETMRATLETLKKDTAMLEKLFTLNPLAKKTGAGEGPGELKSWFDFALLPPFEKISKYFGFTVVAGAAQPDGLSLKYYSPTPPNLKK